MEYYEGLLKAFEYGVDYGLLLAEEERDSEDLLDAAGCASYARRTCVPSSVAPRRQPHSAVWRKGMGEGLSKLIDLIKELED